MTELNRLVERDEPDALIYYFLHQTNSGDGSDNLVVIEKYRILPRLQKMDTRWKIGMS